MGVLDKFLNVMKLNDDYDDDDYLDDEIDDEFEEERPAKKHFFKKNDSFDEDDDFQDDFKIKEARKTKAPAPKAPASERPRQIKTQPVTSSKVSPIRPRKSSGMEVCVIKPKSMEDAREITETLLGGCTEYGRPGSGYCAANHRLFFWFLLCHQRHSSEDQRLYLYHHPVYSGCIR